MNAQVFARDCIRTLAYPVLSLFVKPRSLGIDVMSAEETVAELVRGGVFTNPLR